MGHLRCDKRCGGEDRWVALGTYYEALKRRGWFSVVVMVVMVMVMEDRRLVISRFMLELGETG